MTLGSHSILPSMMPRKNNAKIAKKESKDPRRHQTQRSKKMTIKSHEKDLQSRFEH